MVNYSILNAITPPVALASFTAAGMAKANEMKTSLTAMNLGIVGLIVFLSSALLLWPNNRYADVAGLAIFVVYYFLQRAKLGDGFWGKRRTIDPGPVDGQRPIK